MSHVYTLANAKGGCGKSTVALNLAVCSARSGLRTFAVDLDQQGNLSAALGIDLNSLKRTAHQLLINEVARIEEFLVEVRTRLKLLPYTIDIDADDLLEAMKVNRELLLRKKLKPILREFDIVVVDTPPAMRAATLNGLAVADTLVVPIESSYFALLGLSQLLKVVASIRDAHSPNVVIRALKSVMLTVSQRAGSRINSFAYFVKEILATIDQRTVTGRRRALSTVVKRVRDSHVGQANYGMADFVYDVKAACDRGRVVFDNDLFNELIKTLS